MTRHFNGSNQYLKDTQVVGHSNGLSVSCWINIAAWPAAGTADGTIGFSNPNISNMLVLGNVRDTGKYRLGCNYNGVNKTADTTNLITLNAWNHLYFSLSAGLAMRVVLNGDIVNQGTNTAAGLPTGITDQHVAATGVAGSVVNYFTGNIGHVALWTIDLADDEIGLLAKGFSPSSTRPQNLLSYWPLTSGYSPEIDIFGGQNLTLFNAPTTAINPRMYSAGMLQLTNKGSFASGGSGGGLGSRGIFGSQIIKPSFLWSGVA